MLTGKIDCHFRCESMSLSVVAPKHKYMLLVAWLACHMLVLHMLFSVGCELSREISRSGWKSAWLLLLLVAVNSTNYLGLFHFKSQCPAQHSQKQTLQKQKSDLISSSPLLDPMPHAAVQVRLATSAAVASLSTPWEGSIRFCKHCSTWQLLREHHCHACGVCIPGFDHHCHWLGGCIGIRNHARFWVYLLSQAVLCAYSLHQGLTSLRHAAHSPWSSLHVGGALLTAMLLAVFLLIAALLVFHTFLILVNWKTHEVLKGQLLPYLKGTRVGGKSPFDRGISSNLYNFLFEKQLYDTMVDDWRIRTANQVGMEAAVSSTCWDNSMYSCC